jgi:hypothetical protein
MFMIFMQIEILLLILSALLFAPEIAARIVKYYRAVIAWRDCVDDAEKDIHKMLDNIESSIKPDYELVGTDFVKRQKERDIDLAITKPLLIHDDGSVSELCTKPKKPRPKAMTAKIKKKAKK